MHLKKLVFKNMKFHPFETLNGFMVYSLCCLTPISTIYFSYIVAVSFIGVKL